MIDFSSRRFCWSSRFFVLLFLCSFIIRFRLDQHTSPGCCSSSVLVVVAETELAAETETKRKRKLKRYQNYRGRLTVAAVVVVVVVYVFPALLQHPEVLLEAHAYWSFEVGIRHTHPSKMTMTTTTKSLKCYFLMSGVEYIVMSRMMNQSQSLSPFIE